MTNYTPAQLEAFTKPYPAKPLILGGNASMDHYETTVWERTVEAMLKRRAEAAPDLARLVLEKDKEIARLKAANYAAFTDGMEAAAQICGTLAEVEYDDADGFEAATGCEAAIMQVVKEQRSEQAKPEKDQAND